MNKNFRTCQTSGRFSGRFYCTFLPPKINFPIFPENFPKCMAIIDMVKNKLFNLENCVPKVSYFLCTHKHRSSNNHHVKLFTYIRTSPLYPPFTVLLNYKWTSPRSTYLASRLGTVSGQVQPVCYHTNPPPAYLSKRAIDMITSSQVTR